MSTDPTPTDFTPPELEEIAKLLPAYDILSFIAKGGMGAVYMARQRSLDREVAIKVLPRHFGEDADFRASFEAEAKSMAKLNHPNLISIYDFGQIDGLLYIIMEMVQGKSLYHSSYGKTIDPTEAARIVASICHGLAHAHKYGILHRDIKPANILLDPSASPKIGDFGLARPVGDHEADSSFGTPGYTAPEVVHNPTAVDQSTDIYAVGAILYELLTSKLPDSNYIPAATLVHCDPRFDQIIRKAMHPTPALRYRSAEAMAEEIERVISGNKPPVGQLLQPASKPTTATAKTLLTAVPGTGKPALNTALTPGNTGSPAATTSTTPPVKVGSNIPFVRNIIIIIALLATIYIAWEGLKIVRVQREKENARIAELNEKQKQEAEAERKRKAEEAKKLHRPVPPPVPPPKNIPATPKVETARESLNRLRKALRAGKRDEMPKGTLTQAGRARFFIEDAMSWHQARQYCERYGGHLAVLPENTDLQWLCSKLGNQHTIWLGAGSAGNGAWRWIDGSPWKLAIRNTSKASYVAVNDTGVLDPQPGRTKHSFFIEWYLDGKTPATLENQLKRCAESIAKGSAQYPAGTISYDNRNFLLIQQDSDWNAARALAKLGGGVLAVPSNADENEWMLGLLASSMNKDQACWIGGLRKANHAWSWATGEPWQFARWGKGLPDEDESTDSACAVLPTRTWDDFPVDTALPCFLIEWSKDGEGHTTVKHTATASTGGIGQLHKKCALLVSSIIARYEKDFTNNIKGYEQELRAFHRTLPKSLQEAYGPGILEMQSRYVNNRIPEDIPRAAMPAKLAEILDSRLFRQRKTEAKCLAEIETLREKYRTNLFNIANEHKAKGLNFQLRKVQEEIDETKSGGQSFIDYMLGNG
ncbi:MAG: protein kinase [Akkermansiaceae bacterium]|nr:protein kinase [Akkermansiaceae bacterium]